MNDPSEPRLTVKSIQLATGEISSTTFTVVEHDALFPLSSTTVSSTACEPVMEQSTLAGTVVNIISVQTSNDPLSISEPSKV